MNTKLPDFFIIGAPKCGTTALSEYLRLHPLILFSEPKEPHFFSSDILISNNYSDINEYMNTCFPQNKRQGRSLGEGSVWYLYSQVAVSNILKVRPDAKIIVMLRNPIDMAYSLFYQAKLTFDEDSDTFEDAWQKQEIRQSGKTIPEKCRDTQILQYKKVCSLGSQLERLIDTAPNNQLKIILFDDFITNTKNIYEEVLQFLQLPSDSRSDFPKINEAQKHRFPFIGRLLLSPPHFLMKFNEAAKKTLGIKRLGIRDFVGKYSVKKITKDNLRKPFRMELLREFESEIKKIEELIKRDLSHWRSL